MAKKQLESGTVRFVRHMPRSNGAMREAMRSAGCVEGPPGPRYLGTEVTEIRKGGRVIAIRHRAIHG